MFINIYQQKYLLDFVLNKIKNKKINSIYFDFQFTPE